MDGDTGALPAVDVAAVSAFGGQLHVGGKRVIDRVDGGRRGSGHMDRVGVVDGITGGDDLEHSHTIPDPGHTHTLTGTFTGSMDAYEHSHTHQIQKTKTLRFYERIDNSA